MLSVGNGSRSLLLDAFFEHTELLANYTWHLLPCVDPDRTRLNEGWFAGPFTMREYAKYYHRSTVAEQVKWTFPIVHKRYGCGVPHQMKHKH